ncbi:hypothetical protein HFP72_01310 [Nocardiopsis sp. ARC36]
MGNRPEPTPTTATRRLQVLVAVCSAVFVLGTVLHAFTVLDTALVEAMMREAGGADPEGAAPGFTLGLRTVGCFYAVGNAVGLLALGSTSGAVWWIVLAVNSTQALGSF